MMAVTSDFILAVALVAGTIYTRQHRGTPIVEPPTIQCISPEDIAPTLSLRVYDDRPETLEERRKAMLARRMCHCGLDVSSCCDDDYPWR
jgi:hypothetical protein